MLITFSLLGLSICAAWLEPSRLGKRFSLPPWLVPFIGAIIPYAVTKRIEAPILIHFEFNAVHFVGFTYPRIH